MRIPRVLRRVPFAGAVFALVLAGCDRDPAQPDVDPPTVSISTGAGAADLVTNQTTLALSGTAGDDRELARVEWSSDRGGSGVVTGLESWTATVALEEGANLITVTAFDAEGNSSTDQLAVTRDTQAPTLEINSPNVERSVATAAATYALTGNAADNHAIDRIDWTSSRGASGTATGAAPWTATAQLQPGDNVITFTVRDRAGNTATDRITVTYNQGVQIARPTLNPTGLVVNTSGPVRVTVPLSGTTGLVASSVRLVRVNESGEVTAQVGTLVDNGVLSQGDEILGDGVFSGIFTFSEPAPGNVRLRVTAQAQNGGVTTDSRSPVAFLAVYTPVSTAEYQQIVAVQRGAVDEATKVAAQGFEASVAKAAEWLAARAEVRRVERAGDGMIVVEYQSGLRGGLLVSDEGPGGIVTLGGAAPATRTLGSTWQPPLQLAPVQTDTPRRPLIPVARQTRGTAPPLRAAAPAGFPRAAQAPASPDAVLDRDVLVYSPFASEFGSWEAGVPVASAVAESDLKFDVTFVRNASADVATLMGMTRYGLVFINTHGAQGKYLLTGEETDADSRTRYAAMLRDGSLIVLTKTKYKILGIWPVQGEYFMATPAFVRGLSGSFPRSIVINSSCESTMTTGLSDAFHDKGAQTYFGYSKTVWSNFAHARGQEVVRKLVVDLQTTGQAFTAGVTDPLEPHAVWERVWSDKAHFSAGLVNGDFEFGVLSGWNPSGDGRVITRLGSQAPNGAQMAVISTGLGYTTATGEIRQTFRVAGADSLLAFRWNFLSEEFMEYVGSQYQDYFRVILEVKGGSNVTLLSRTIDQFASLYSLVSVSPGIVFDRGGVYMTSWRSASFDLRPYRGKTVTLRFLVGDVGDSLFDSAVLLDDVQVHIVQ